MCWNSPPITPISSHQVTPLFSPSSNNNKCLIEDNFIGTPLIRKISSILMTQQTSAAQRSDPLVSGTGVNIALSAMISQQNYFGSSNDLSPLEDIKDWWSKYRKD